MTDTVMTKITKNSITLSESIIAEMGRASVYELAVILCLDDQIEEALKLLTLKVDSLGDPQDPEPMHRLLHEVFHKLDESNMHDMDQDKANKIDHIKSTLAPAAARSLLALHSNHKVLGSSINYWLSLPEQSVKAFEKEAPGLLCKLATNSPPRVTSRNDTAEWSKYKAAFTHVPTLLEKLTSESANNNKHNKKGNHTGSPGLLMAASIGDLELFKRCLSATEAIGVNPAEAVSHMWLDDHQNDLPKPYDTNNALTEALAGGHMAIAEYILSINPKLSVMDEALRMGKTCDLLIQQEAYEHDAKIHYTHIKEQSMAMAQAIELHRSVKHPEPKEVTRSTSKKTKASHTAL